jgi:DNA-directed RNA polymerase subunit beta'
MAVHVPLSLEAQLEARVLMMSTNNVLSPANGAPIIVPSQDMVLGLYYTTMERKGMVGEGMAFADIEEVEHALAAGAVHLHAKIKGRLRQVDEHGNIVWKRYETTPGRLRLGNLLPLNAKAPFTGNRDHPTWRTDRSCRQPRPFRRSGGATAPLRSGDEFRRRSRGRSRAV